MECGLASPCKHSTHSMHVTMHHQFHQPKSSAQCVRTCLELSTRGAVTLHSQACLAMGRSSSANTPAWARDFSVPPQRRPTVQRWRLELSCHCGQCLLSNGRGIPINPTVLHWLGSMNLMTAADSMYMPYGLPTAPFPLAPSPTLYLCLV